MIFILSPGVVAPLSYPKYRSKTKEDIILKMSIMVRDTSQCLVQMGILLELQERKNKKRFTFRYKLTPMASAYLNHHNAVFGLYILQ